MKRGKIVWERILTSFGCTTRVSVINVWTQNDPFNDPCEVILTSQMAVSEMVVMRNINFIIIHGKNDRIQNVRSRYNNVY